MNTFTMAQWQLSPCTGSYAHIIAQINFGSRNLNCDCSVSAYDTAVLASPVTILQIPMSFAVDRELLKYLSSACKSLNSTGIVSSTWAGQQVKIKFKQVQAYIMQPGNDLHILHN